MSYRDPTARMWAEACALVDEAARLHRQFFRIGAPATWEPPADVYEDERDLVIVIALPGVRPERVAVSREGSEIVVRAERRLPLGERRVAIRQLEIPHGLFEKRVALPAAPLAAIATEWAEGCLIITLRKAD